MGEAAHSTVRATTLLPSWAASDIPVQASAESEATDAATHITTNVIKRFMMFSIFSNSKTPLNKARARTPYAETISTLLAV